MTPSLMEGPLVSAFIDERTNHTGSYDSDDVRHLPLSYALLEGFVAVGSSFGNLLIVIVFLQDKRLRKVTNFYIVSLAIADLLVGLFGVPSAILQRIGIPRHSFHGCLTMLSLLVVLCTISILNLVAVSLDRFWAILYPLNYHRTMSSQAAGAIIVSCWIIGALIGFLPLFGWNNGPHPQGFCYFIPIMSYRFLVFLFFATIFFPALLMAFCYLRIYFVVVRQLRQISIFNRTRRNSKPKNQTGKCRFIKNGDGKPVSNGRDRSASTSPDDSLRLNHSSNNLNAIHNGHNSKNSPKVSFSRREVKKARKLAIIVAFFMVCWIPLYLNNTIEAFYPGYSPPYWLLDTLVILSHLNSAVNPILYAYHMKDFREAMHRILCLCVFRRQGLRDIRRQELVSLSGRTGRKKNKNVLASDAFDSSLEIEKKLPT